MFTDGPIMQTYNAMEIRKQSISKHLKRFITKGKRTFIKKSDIIFIVQQENNCTENGFR